MDVAMYVNDSGGLKTYSKYLADALKFKNVKVVIVDNFKYPSKLYHIQFESSLFHPFGLFIIPKLLFLKLKKIKIVITMHTILSKDNIYSRNNLINFFKKLISPITYILVGKICNKVIVHRKFLKEILIKEYNFSENKIEVISHGSY